MLTLHSNGQDGKKITASSNILAQTGVGSSGYKSYNELIIIIENNPTCSLTQKFS
jgi:hypothetical protein